MAQTPILTPAQLAALGAVVVYSAELEHRLNLMIEDLTGMDNKQLRAVSRGGMLQDKLITVEKLGELKFKGKTNRKRLKNLISHLRERNTERTIVVHGVWLPRVGGALTQLLANYQGDPADITAINYKTNATFKADRLSKLAVDIQVLTEELWQLFMDKRALPAIKRNEYRRLKRKEFNDGMLNIKQQIEGISARIRAGWEAGKKTVESGTRGTLTTGSRDNTKG